MSETQQGSGEYNPFDPANHSQGGGLWDGKTVTITSSVAKTEALKYGDGKPVLDVKGQQSIQTALYLTGISDGGDDKERHEEYSVGDRLTPTPDGEGFVPKDGGGPLKFHANSNMGKLNVALKGSGFDIGSLLVRDAAGAVVYLAPGVPKQQFSKLVGARFVFKAEAKLGKDGKPVKDKKGYDKHIHLPVKFVGYVAGGPQPGRPAAGGNGGGAGAAPGALDSKAVTEVVKALGKAEGGKLTRAELVRTLAQNLAGDADSNGIIGLVVRDDFHKGKPWTYDGQQASL